MNSILKIDSACWFGLAMGLVSAAWAVRCITRRRVSMAYRLGFVLACIISIETLVFRNPVFFKVASRYLHVEDIGWRQSRALVKEVSRFTKPIETPLLAVGSSQTGAIYIPYAAQDPNLSLFTLSGMGPLDLLLYQELIKKRGPDMMILSLSDFDIGRMPSLAGAKLAPPQAPRKLAHICALLLRTPGITWSDVQDLIAANTLSAYRYQYIFKGILDRMSGRNAAFPEADVTTISDEEYLALHLESLSKLEARWFGVNLVLLDEFLAWTRAQGIDVTMTEGHYHPRALAKNHDLHEQASVALSRLCVKYPNVVFVRTEEVRALSEDDYRDGYHLRTQSGYEFAAAVVKLTKLRRRPAPQPDRASITP